MDKITWHDIQDDWILKMHNSLIDKFGDVSRKEWNEAYDLVGKHFSTWENKVEYCANSDRQLASVVFVHHATKRLGLKYKSPLQIMRAVYSDRNNFIR